MEILLYISIFLLIIVLGIILILLAIYVFYTERGKRLNKELDSINSYYNKNYKNFFLVNPYDVKGSYKKAQLHTHTNKSDGKLSPGKLVKNYKEKGYSFLAITDHDKVTDYHKYNDDKFLTITGEEMTWSKPFWPLGQHLLRLFVKERFKSNNLQDIINQTVDKDKGIVVINHPTSFSGLGTQYWELEELLKLKNICLIEIVNHFSQEEKNIKYWHELLKKLGPEESIWGIASDDTHIEKDIDKEWLMVKVNNISEKALHEALSKGSFYLTQGPNLNFSVNNRCIEIKSDQLLEFKIIDANHNIRKTDVGTNLLYTVTGDEGFIRVEGLNLATDKKVWSQPFWLQKKL